MTLLAIVEIEKHSKEKYEYDVNSGKFILDRIVPIPYPEAYGFIPNTLSGDGDPMDVLIISKTQMKRGDIIPIDILCILNMEDEKGMDEKIIASPVHENIDFSLDTKKTIENFFIHYKKNDPNRWSKVIGWIDMQKSTEIVMKSFLNLQKPY